VCTDVMIDRSLHADVRLCAFFFLLESGAATGVVWVPVRCLCSLSGLMFEILYFVWRHIICMISQLMQIVLHVFSSSCYIHHYKDKIFTK
jgi:hypothetical protein